MTDDGEGPVVDCPDELPAVPGTRLLGVAGAGVPVYHDPAEERIISGERRGEAETYVADPTTERYLDDETLGDAIAHIDEALGWERLTEYGRERRPYPLRPDSLNLFHRGRS
ncbi:MAG: hypothetical protein ABEJ04_07615 [Halobacteriaceae archaeon]